MLWELCEARNEALMARMHQAYSLVHFPAGSGRTILSQIAARTSPRLEVLHPGPHLHLVGPGAGMLPDDVEIRGGDRVGIEQARGLAGRLRAALAFDAAVDDDMGHMDALGRSVEPT